MTSPRIGCIFRAHFWDSQVEANYRALRAAWDGDVLVMFDATNGPIMVPSTTTDPGWRQLDFTLDNITALGLPLLPTRQTCLWHCGDYALALLSQRTDYDCFLMFDYDVLVTVPLRPIVDAMMSDQMDFVAPHVRPNPSPQWMWTKVQQLADALEGRRRPIWASFFPVVFCSRSLAEWLLARRQDLAWASQSAEAWPMAESFVPTEAATIDRYIAPLERYVRRLQMTTLDLLSEAEARAGGFAMAHPVLGGNRLARLIAERAPKAAARAGMSPADWLCRQLSTRDFDEEQRIILVNAIHEATPTAKAGASQ